MLFRLPQYRRRSTIFGGFLRLFLTWVPCRWYPDTTMAATSNTHRTLPTQSGFPPAKATSGLVFLLGPSAPRPRPDTSGIPLGEVLGRALAEARGEEYQPPKLAELEDLLGPENFALLIENPKIAAAVKLWANAAGEDRASLVKPLATLIAHEAGQPDLAFRIRKEIGRLK
jgi:hypothetical protein